MAVNIICIERVIVAVRALAESRENWRRAGFGIAPVEFQHSGTRIASLAAGAVEIDLCELDAHGDAGFLAEPIREALENGGGIIGWTWGVKDVPHSDARDSKPTVSIVLPGLS